MDSSFDCALVIQNGKYGIRDNFSNTEQHKENNCERIINARYARDANSLFRSLSILLKLVSVTK
jgi:hypothetical protein